MPKQITYEKDGYIYTYVLTENSPLTFNGVELSDDDIMTKDGQVISNKLYGYKLFYTNEPKISAGTVFVSPTKGSADPRNVSEIASGGENLSNPLKSMRGSNGNIGLVPKEVADNLGGREFSNFDEFRKAFWKEYSNSSYASEFSKSNIKRMSQGLAPKAPASQQYGKISSYVLHHKNPIYNGGGVYDLDNIVISSPRMHQEILDKGFHFNK
ncbi:hypothetical protein [Clostridium kluyveri]|uniref:hypothetical protein n=1 Tax=Clostridium kluyveri TaxID=1534 RepID=UPI0022470E15|nr:hypothetical protein [Clostridium kluyveri]UZQ50422.1 hypothetical protein OP486_21225 [Clostridium kluyveri]